MKRYDREIELSVLRRLTEALTAKEFKILHEDQWKTALLKKVFDIVIYKGTLPLAVIEVKRDFKSKHLLAMAADQVRSALSITNARYGVITDSQVYYLYDRNQKDADFVICSFQEIIGQLVDPVRVRVSAEDRADIARIFITNAKEYVPENKIFCSFVESKMSHGRFVFDENKNSFCFVDEESGLSSFENQFFDKLLGDFKDNKICRYTSFNTIFDMLKYLSFRMNGIAGMNDRSEVNYVDSYINGIQKPLEKEHHNTIIALNKRYITSCATNDRKDDLTLWRMYADDAKGVCLVFDINRKNLNNKVLLKKVKYAEKNGIHKELELLKHIREDIEDLTGFKFEFRKIGYWKHFFKPYDYQAEDEVRLLVIDDGSLNKIDSDFVLTYTHSIVNPIIDFRLNSKSFPIKLSEIVLGSKCPEQETNYVQLQEMIRRKRTEIKKKKYDSNLNYLKVELSSINHYR